MLKFFVYYIYTCYMVLFNIWEIVKYLRYWESMWVINKLWKQYKNAWLVDSERGIRVEYLIKTIGPRKCKSDPSSKKKFCNWKVICNVFTTVFRIIPFKVDLILRVHLTHICSIFKFSRTCVWWQCIALVAYFPRCCLGLQSNTFSDAFNFGNKEEC